MGADTFAERAKGKNAQEAFEAAVSQAQYEYGHRGYTGSLAEKYKYTIIPIPADNTPDAYAEKLITDGDPRIDDKWGPAGCIDCGNGEYLFFGWASS